MRITIFSFAVNDKFPIDLQVKQFRKHLCEPFDFVIVNDAPNVSMINKINEIANKLSVKCIQVPQNIHKISNPSVGYADALNWLVDCYVNNKNFEIIMMVHTDVFPIKKTSVDEMIKNYGIASTLEHRRVGKDPLYYLYPALTLLNLKKVGDKSLLNFDCGTVHKIIDGVKISVGLDTGGMTYKYIDKYKDNVKIITHICESNDVSCFDDRTNKYLRYDSRICKKYKISRGWFTDTMFHFLAGSQWNISDLKLAKFEKSGDNLKSNAATYIRKWYLFYKNKKKIIGNHRRLSMCLSFFN